jgi:PKD repeat protein
MSSTRRVSGRRSPRAHRPSVLVLEGRTLLAASPRIDTFAVPTIVSFSAQIINGPDGDLWFNEFPFKIGRITPQGQVTEFPLPIPAGGTLPEPTSITAGPDGAIWAIDESNGQVDRIAHDGQVESFAIPGVSAGGGSNASGSLTNGPTNQLGRIVAGADGNLWFSTVPPIFDSWNFIPSTQSGTIDRITPQGVVTQFSLPVGGGAAASLAAGLDGIWFTDPSANRVGEIDFSGHVVEFGAPTPDAGDTVDLAVGPDGDAYFVTQTTQVSQAEFGFAFQASQADPGSFIVKVTPAGAMTTIIVPGLTELSLLTGSDGIYLLGSTDTDNTQLERLGPDGTLTPIVTGPGLPDSDSEGVTFGPDGNLWFTEESSALIERMVLAPTPVPAPGPTLVGAGLVDSLGTGGATIPDIITPVGQATLLTLADFRHSADVSGVSATVNWGDGSATITGTLGPAPSNPFGDNTDPSSDPFVDGQVSGTHNYANAGLYPVTITLRGAGPGGATITTEVAATVSAVDPSPSPVSPPLVLQVANTIAFQGAVAQFSTPTLQDSSNFTATVDWGDGSATTTGTIVGGYIQSVPTLPPGLSAGSNFNVETVGPCTDFQVSGGHTYATAGTFTVKVTLTDQFGHSSTASTPIQVVPGPLTITPINPAVFSPFPPATYTGPVEYPLILGTLTDFQGSLPGRTYSATVNWGDGSVPTAGIVVPQVNEFGGPTTPVPTVFNVEGNHVYAQPGEYTITYTVNDNQGDIVEATTTYQTPALAGITLTPVAGGSTVGDPLVGINVASITMPNASDSASDLTATINWGDGSAPTFGAVGPGSENGNSWTEGVYVTGNHTYTAAGLYVVTVTVNGPGSSTAQAFTSVTAALSSALTSDGGLPTALDFTQGVGRLPIPLASILVQNSAITDYKATVDWGDGSPLQPATLEPDTTYLNYQADYLIVAGHDYAQAGTYTVTITAVGADGIPDIMYNQAIVAPSPTPIIVTPIIIASPPPTTTTPSPIASPEPTPVVSPPAPPVMWPFLPTIFPSPFPKFSPTVAKHPKPIAHPKAAKPVAHPKTTKPVAHPKAAKPVAHPKPAAHPAATPAKKSKPVTHHVVTKSAHVTPAKKHPTGPARLAKSPR